MLNKDILKNSKVIIFGLGGLGSNIATMLARVNVGHLFLIDFDKVEISNLNRQNYNKEHIGMLKTQAIKDVISKINSDINIKIQNIYVDEKNILKLVKDYDVICEAFDNPESKAMLVNTILSEYPNKKIVAASGMSGYFDANSIVTKKINKNLFICGDFKSYENNEFLAPRVNICAGHQANMILRLLLGEEV